MLSDVEIVLLQLVNNAEAVIKLKKMGLKKVMATPIFRKTNTNDVDNKFYGSAKTPPVIAFFTPVVAGKEIGSFHLDLTAK